MNTTTLRLPYLTKEEEGIGGKIKVVPEDFIVEEIPIYEPDGEGEHLFIHLTKKGITTKDVQEKLTRLYQVKRQDVNCAGIKDKQAVASQYFSVWLKNNEDKDLVYKMEEDLPVKIHSTKFHRRKIKQGHLLGNAFNVKITQLKENLQEAFEKTSKIIDLIHRQGLPNFYGSQRFGIDGDNAQKGYELILGQRKMKNKWLKKFLMSAYQSHLFNHYMIMRIQKGLYNTMLVGDIAKKHDTGGIFIVEDDASEQKRLDNKEICYTGPMFGKKMTRTTGESIHLEENILTDNNITMEQLSSARLTGTRRQGIVIPAIQAEKEEDGIRLRFTLPKGAFATIVLREFMKNDM